MASATGAEESVNLIADHDGPVNCRTLTVAEGVTLRGRVEADEIRLKGVIEGNVSANRFSILAGAEYRGEADVEVMRLAGTVRGLVIAKDLLAKGSARLEGFLIADVYGAEPGACIRATIVSEPGASMNPELRAGARRELTGAGVLAPLQGQARAERAESGLSEAARSEVEAAMAAALGADLLSPPAAEPAPPPPRPKLRLAKPVEPREPAPEPERPAAGDIPPERAPEASPPGNKPTRASPRPAGTTPDGKPRPFLI